jgi:hypothetical protein
MIYIQSNTEKTLPHHGDAASALYGAIDSGLDFKLIKFEDIPKFKNLIKSNLFVGSTEFMIKVFLASNIMPKRPPNSNREHEETTLGEVRARVEDGEKLFIKPFEIKLFTGLVVDKFWINSCREFPDYTQVMVYEVIHSIYSEWRLYIHNHQLIDAKNYSGNFKISPSESNYEEIEKIINSNKATFPCAYVMDIGLIDNGCFFIVEYNDFWAIGNYGIPNDLYLRMLKDRYFEIIRS